MPRRYLLSLIWIYLTVLLCIGPISAADGVLAFAEGGYSGAETTLFHPDESENTYPLALPGSEWGFTGNVARQRRFLEDGITSLYAALALPADNSHSATETTLIVDYSADIDRNANLTDYASLAFGLRLDGTPGTHYTVRIAIETLSETVDAALLVSVAEDPTAWHLIQMDIGRANGVLRRLRISVEYEDAPMPVAIRCTMPYLTNHTGFGFRNASRFATNHLRAEVGAVTLSSGMVLPDDGRAYLTAPLVMTAPPKPGTNAYLELRLEGVTGGNLTLGLLYAGTTEEQRQLSKKISLTASDGIYTIPLDIYGEIYSYSLQFDNIDCDGYFSIRSIRFFTGTDLPLSGNPDVGTLSSITRTADGIRFAGSLAREMLSLYPDAKLTFYALPQETQSDLSTALTLGSMKLATFFEITLDLSAYPHLADTHLFCAAVTTEKEALLLSRPRYIDASALPSSTLSTIGLYDAASVGAFEANASHILVDVPLVTLLSGGTRHVSYPDYNADGVTMRTLAFNSALLDSLTQDIAFYRSAGMEVYLRILPAGFVEAGEEDIDRYAAIIRYLAEQFSTVAGFVLGADADILTDAAAADPGSYSAVLADYCRVTYNASVGAIPDVFLIVPFSADTADLDDANRIAARSLAVMLSDRLSEVGTLPWALLLSFDDADEDLTAVTAFSRLLTELELRGADATLFLYEPTSNALRDAYNAHLLTLEPGSVRPESSEYAATRFAELCSRLSIYRPRAVFFSLSSLPLRSDHAFYAGLKDISGSARFVYDDAATVAEAHPDAASHTIWDFSGQYYPLGWLPGGGALRCTTESSTRFSDTAGNYTRVLRTVYDASATGIAGITMRTFTETHDLSGVDRLRFTFSIEEATDDTIALGTDGVTVVFVLGSNDRRAEYYASALPVGEIHTLSCDLTGFEYRNAVDYVGIMVYADHAVTLDLASAVAESDTLPAEVLAHLFAEESSHTASLNYPLIAALCVFLVVLSAVAVILLTRRDREEEEQRARDALKRNKRPYVRRHS